MTHQISSRTESFVSIPLLLKLRPEKVWTRTRDKVKSSSTVPSFVHTCGREFDTWGQRATSLHIK